MSGADTLQRRRLSLRASAGYQGPVEVLMVPARTALRTASIVARPPARCLPTRTSSRSVSSGAASRATRARCRSRVRSRQAVLVT
jgi:hypothetical protein